ncbi:MFS transporter [Microbacterium rhizomatis]|uniref:MFS transporter n=1 Tax=Microbacterium rhizomatis TaxID=1631477 RepID=A0A5J5J104_9MICO|nr:MFS transporter [Microbacterium rhizomatis]KAA9108027.1 MFS transporter [Microbacterium rhizomatis]
MTPNDMVPRDITRTLPFWLIFAASALGAMTNAASTPIIPLYVAEILGGGVTLSGVVISLAALASIAAMPIAGSYADRKGYRRIALIGGGMAIVALVLLAVVPTLWSAVTSRLLFGLGNSAAMTLVMAWLVAIAPPRQRGKALSIYGLSVWLGVAAGPQLGSAVNQSFGPLAVFGVCAVLELITFILIASLPSPIGSAAARAPRGERPRLTGRALMAAFGAVWVPGVAAAAAWCGEGLMLGFLIVHLTGRGVPEYGVFGAASVFAVFAVSVIAARLVLAGMPDRIGPLRSTGISLTSLSAGMATLALAGDFWVAAVGAVLIGIGFSPLYPSLTMLATRGLHDDNRALGLGLFSSFTSVGYAGGALIGGVVIAMFSSMWAFLLVAGLQLVALAVVTIFTHDDHPRSGRGDEPRDPAA